MHKKKMNNCLSHLVRENKRKTHSIHYKIKGMRNESHHLLAHAARMKVKDSPSEFCASKVEPVLETRIRASFGSDGTVGVHLG